MSSRALVLVLLLALAVPALAAGPHLDPGTIVAEGEPDEGAVVLLYVQGRYGDAQSVYVVQRVARCGDSGGPGWYALRAGHDLRSAPELEMRERLETVCPCTLPFPDACASAGSGPGSNWDRLVAGTLEPFGPVAFPSIPAKPAG